MQEKYLNMSIWGIALNAFKTIFKYPKLILPYVLPTVFLFISLFVFALPLLLLAKIENQNMLFLITTILLLITGTVFMCWSFWEYLFAYIISVKISQKALCGEVFDIKSERECAKPKIWGYAWLLTIVSFFAFLLFVPIKISIIYENVIFIILSVIVCMAILIFLLLRLALINQTYVLNENISAVDAIKLSYKIVKEKKIALKIFLLWLYVTIISLPLFLLNTIPFIGIILNIIGQIIMFPIFVLALTHLYLKTIEN